MLKLALFMCLAIVVCYFIGNINFARIFSKAFSGKDITKVGSKNPGTMNMLRTRNPASIKICTLFDKPDRREADIHADYSGSLVPDEFIVGYGLDYDEKYRNLPYIGVLKPEIYN